MVEKEEKEKREKRMKEVTVGRKNGWEGRKRETKEDQEGGEYQ